MGHAAVAPEVTVLNAEGKSDHIEIRYNGTDCTGQEDRPPHRTMHGDLTECECHEGMRKCRGHEAVRCSLHERQRPS